MTLRSKESKLLKNRSHFNNNKNLSNSVSQKWQTAYQWVKFNACAIFCLVHKQAQCVPLRTLYFHSLCSCAKWPRNFHSKIQISGVFGEIPGCAAKTAFPQSSSTPTLEGTHPPEMAVCVTVGPPPHPTHPQFISPTWRVFEL